jgi:hypothetical protein
MALFKIRTTEVLCRTTEAKADSLAEAIDIVENLYLAETIVLDSDDFVSVSHEEQI